MGQVKSHFFDSIESMEYEPHEPQPHKPEPERQGRKIYLLLCGGKPLALYDHLDTAYYEMYICKQGDMHEGVENTYRIKTMYVVTHAYEDI